MSGLLFNRYRLPDDYRPGGLYDVIVCANCRDRVVVPRGQTIVMSRRQSGHTCGDPVWHVPDYVPTTTGRRRTRQETPA